jgi:hypothetical protein
MEVVGEDMEKIISKATGVGTLMIFTMLTVSRMDTKQGHAKSIGRISKTRNIINKTKKKYQNWKRVKHLNLLSVLFPIAILE